MGHGSGVKGQGAGGQGLERKEGELMGGSGFRNLTTWQKAYELGLHIYRASRNFPAAEQYSLTSQLRRAAVSVAANIAEGYERQHRKEYLQFLNIARGSLGEVETYLHYAKDLGYLSAEAYSDLETKRQEVGRLLKGLIRSLVP